MIREYSAKAKAFVGYLDSKREDKGAMADLRYALIPGLSSRSLQYLAPFCNVTNPYELALYATVAAAFGNQPKCADDAGDIGNLFYRIAWGTDKKDGLNSFALRFRRVLDCKDVPELADHLHGVFRTARQRDLPIDHARLFDDLRYWSGDNRAKLRWAQSYFRQPEKKNGEE